MTDQRIKLGENPTILLLAMHGFVKGDTEALAHKINLKMNKYARRLKYYYVGLLLGKYDVLLEMLPMSVNASGDIIEDFRKWLWDGRIRGTPIRGCLSTMTCHEILSDETFSEETTGDVRTYTLFRLISNTQEELISLVETIAQMSKKTHERPHLFWNPSAMSYLVKTAGDDFKKTFTFLYQLRENIFLRDFCTFVALKFDGNDRATKCDGLHAMINIKLGEPGLTWKFLDRFPDGRIRLGHFDLLRDTCPQNLSSVFDYVKETRAFVHQSATNKALIRTGTILGFERRFFETNKRNKI
jgi:hypothetical protein